jgi:SAM-dependent MidA family methyltransferase
VSLPTPEPRALAHSERVTERIRAEIESAGGAISFDRYMALALSAPGLGYYNAGTRKFGAAGDFITAPEISPLFARTLARQVADVLAGLRGADLFELGPGSGVMAAELLAELERLGELPATYRLLEPSPELRERQGATLAARVPQLLERVSWLETLPDPPIEGVIIANEVLDALPVHVFCLTAQGIIERAVGWDGSRFCWVERDPTPTLAAAVAELGMTPTAQRYCSELNLALRPWIAALAGCLHRGLVLLVDYGYPRSEYYLPERLTGTLMCHYRHRAHPDPFLYPGLQDISAYVDFTAVAEAAVEAGLRVAGFTDQASFLLNCGLTEHLEAAATDVERLILAQQVKTLTLPSEMGERFKVMGLSRGLTGGLRGFAGVDRAARL